MISIVLIQVLFLFSEQMFLNFFSKETMFWYKPRVTGTIPEPRRAHTANLIDNKLYIYGGGDSQNYFSHLYLFDVGEKKKKFVSINKLNQSIHFYKSY